MKIKEFKKLSIDEQIKLVNKEIEKIDTIGEEQIGDLEVDYIWIFNYFFKRNIAPLEEKQIENQTIFYFRKMTDDEIKNKKKIEENISNRIDKETEESTYIVEGMLLGAVIGTAIGIAVGNFTQILYIPICISISMMIGLTIGSGIKKKNKK